MTTHTRPADPEAELARRLEAFDAARVAYLDALAACVAHRVRRRLPGAAALEVHYGSIDDGDSVYLAAVLDAAGEKLADIGGDDDQVVLLAEDVAEEVDAMLITHVDYGGRPDGGVFRLPDPVR
jgi:hypothetical protein